MIEAEHLTTALRAASPGELVEIRYSRRVLPEGPLPQETEGQEFRGENRAAVVTLGAQPARPQR